MTVSNATTRFSERANQYSLYRPGYPEAIIAYLEQTIGLNKTVNIADIGSGTGLFSRLLLEAGYAVNAVEPNREMREAAEATLAAYTALNSIAGTAEDTMLADHSIDLITVAQAFHWFRPEETKREFDRILKPSGHVLLVWNILQSDTPFLKAYKELKETYSEKLEHSHRDNLERISAFFHPAPVTTHQFRHAQPLNETGLKGHLLSFSTVPLEEADGYTEMMQELAAMFTQYAEQGLVRLEYETRLYLAPSAKAGA